MQGDGSLPLAVDRGTRESSQHDKPSIPRAESRIQKIPTKDPAKQYYSKQSMGGWRILNEKEAAKQMKREGMKHMGNTESIRDKLGGVAQNEQVEETSVNLEEGGSYMKPTTPHHYNRLITTTIAASPSKKRKTDYLRLIACIPSDRLWKSWENKHLLRSYANGLSFAQIASSSEFSNSLVIRNEAECRARFEALQQWQPFQDAELLRVGGLGVDENFARTCSEKFSKGLVKRSEKQCKERYDFLVQR